MAFVTIYHIYHVSCLTGYIFSLLEYSCLNILISPDKTLCHKHGHLSIEVLARKGPGAYRAWVINGAAHVDK
jgi:hypothetical protein